MASSTHPPATPALIRAAVAHAPRRGLIAGLALSIAVHAALSFWPTDDEAMPETVPLQASITQLPPPPAPAAVAPPKPRPKPQRATATRPPTKPVINLESRYDNEFNQKQLPRLPRSCGYWSFLSGCAGYTYGTAGLFNWD